MALNNFTDAEAIEVAIEVRERLNMDYDLPLKERWKEKDALARGIELAKEYAEEKKKCQAYMC